MGKKSKKSKKKSGKQTQEPVEEPTPGPSRELDTPAEEQAIAATVRLKRGDAQPGEFVYQGLPVAFAVHDAFVGIVCNYCLSQLPRLICPNCRIMAYCHNECKFKDIYHNATECPNIIRRNFVLPSAFTRYVAEVVVRYRRDPEKVNGETLLRHAMTFDDLECCRHQIGREDIAKKMREVYAEVEGYLRPSDMISFPEFTEVYGKAIQFACKVYIANAYRSKAMGLYLGQWLLPHSCVPNTAATWNGRLLQYFITEPVPGRCIELVTANQLGYSAKVRIDRLIRMGSLCMAQCYCKRCRSMDEDQAFCEVQVPSDHPLVKRVECSKKILKSMEKRNADDMARVLKIATSAWEDMEHIYGRLNKVRAKIARYLCFAHFYKAEFRESRHYCLRLLEFCNAFYGPNHPRSVLILLILSYIEALTNKEESSKKNFLIALERVKICMGEKHIFYYGLSADGVRILEAGGWNADVIQMVEDGNYFFRKDRFEL